MRPPVAKTIAEEAEIHGQRRRDDYAWLKNKEDPEVIAYLEAENAYTEHEMAHTKALQQTLYEEMVGRIQETDLSVPVRIDNYLYYSRTEEGRQYPIYCRKPGDEGEEEVLLDLNAEAAGHDYLSLGLFEVSPDHRLLAFSLDTTGAESYTLRFKNLERGTLLDDKIEDVSYGLEWANDSRTVFYTVEDHAKRPYRLLRHELGQTADDAVIFEEPDELFRVGLSKTKDHAFLVLRIASIETSECRLLNADLGEPAFHLVEPRDPGHRYSVEHRGGLLYILSNRDAPNFRLMTVPVAQPAEANWREMLPHDPGIMLMGLDMFEDFLAIYERRSGLRSIRVLALDDQSAGSSASLGGHEVTFDEPVFTVSGGRNPMYRSRTLRFSYTSLTTPASIYDYDMSTRERQLLKRQPVLGGFDRDDYESERLFVTAEDGAKIPVSLVYRKGLERNGAAPCLLYGYGAYGMSSDPRFSSHRLSLLDRGMVYAIAHIRGGQEMGRQWYDHGKFLNKKNSFLDFIAAGECAGRGRLHSKRPPRHHGRQCGRPSGRRRPQHGARPCEGRGRQGAVRGCHQHHARRDPAADRPGIRGMGQPERPGLFRLHLELLALRQCRGPGLSAYPRDRRPERPARALLGAGEMDSQAARHQDRRQSTAPEDQYGGRAWRRVRAL